MAITYTVNTAGVTMLVGTKTTLGSPNVTDWTRGYMKFNLAGLGITLAKTISVKLRVYVASQIGGAMPYICQMSKVLGTSWGDVLQATQADHDSTKDYNEETKTINGLGWVEFEINKAHLNYSGWNWFRLVIVGGAGGYTNISINSQNAGSNRPVLRIFHNV
jgi:hypothetical protein